MRVDDSSHENSGVLRCPRAPVSVDRWVGLRDEPLGNILAGDFRRAGWGLGFGGTPRYCGLFLSLSLSLFFSYLICFFLLVS